MLECRDLCKSFNRRKVIDSVSFKIEKKEVFGIMGISGGGKSVLIQMMAGLLKPDAGSILFEHKKIETMNYEERRAFARRMGYMFQNGALFDSMTVFDNLALPLREHTDLKLTEIRKQIKNILKELDLGPIMEKMPHELSGGMLKRVGLARAVILSPEIIFCDEPCSGLDPIRKKRVYELIKKIRDRFEATVIVVTHDTDSVPFFADRVALLHRGKIAAIEENWQKLSPLYKEFTAGSPEFLEASGSE